MEEALIKELLSQNIGLREKLLAYEPKSEEYASKFILLSMNPTIKISGVLIAEGIWKGVLYQYDEMKKALPKFNGLKGLVMHGHTVKYQSKQIGKLTKVMPNDTLRALVFEAEVTDQDAINDIKNGMYDAVSISGGFGVLDKTSQPLVGINYDPIEWSLTGTPACDRCMIFSYEELSKAFKDESCKDMTSNEVVKEEISMSKEPVKEQPKVEVPSNAPEVKVEPIKQETPQPTKKEEVKEVPKPEEKIKIQEPQKVEVVVKVEQIQPKGIPQNVQPTQPIPQPSQPVGTTKEEKTITPTQPVTTETPPSTQNPKPPLPQQEQEKPMTINEMFQYAKKEGKLMDFAVLLMEKEGKKRYPT